VVLLVVDLREQNDELGRHGGRNHHSASLHHFYRHDLPLTARPHTRCAAEVKAGQGLGWTMKQRSFTGAR
jgi:hypothetical protein